ncbi:MAG: hypothetical protein LCH77_10980 [Actinobacteria bacterium]|nr:hypothetical protein [Actinomycetota bacterium]
MRYPLTGLGESQDVEARSHHNGSMLVVLDHRRGLVELSSAEPGATGVGLTPAIGALIRPYTVVAGLVPGADRAGVVVADSGLGGAVVHDPRTGASVALIPDLGAAGGPARDPRGVAVDGLGRILLADTGQQRILRSEFTLADAWTGPVPADAWVAYGARPGAGGPGLPGSFVAPVAIAVDAAGRIWISDAGLHRLVRVDELDGSGWVTIALPLTDAGRGRATAGLADTASGMAVCDPTGGKVWVIPTDPDTGAPGPPAVLVDGAADRSLIAPVGLTRSGTDWVVADAGGARLVSFADAGGPWAHRHELLGRDVVGAPADRVVGIVDCEVP